MKATTKDIIDSLKETLSTKKTANNLGVSLSVVRARLKAYNDFFPQDKIITQGKISRLSNDIIQYRKSNPNATILEISSALKTSAQYVCKLLKEMGKNEI